MGSRPWPFVVTWRHRSRDHTTCGGRLSMGGPLWSCVYLASLSRYSHLKLFQGSSRKGSRSVVGRSSILHWSHPLRYVRNVAWVEEKNKNCKASQLHGKSTVRSGWFGRTYVAGRSGDAESYSERRGTDVLKRDDDRVLRVAERIAEIVVIIVTNAKCCRWNVVSYCIIDHNTMQKLLQRIRRTRLTQKTVSRTAVFKRQERCFKIYRRIFK